MSVTSLCSGSIGVGFMWYEMAHKEHIMLSAMPHSLIVCRQCEKSKIEKKIKALHNHLNPSIGIVKKASADNS